MLVYTLISQSRESVYCKKKQGNEKDDGGGGYFLEEDGKSVLCCMGVNFSIFLPFFLFN